jgi:hypothetical protein
MSKKDLENRGPKPARGNLGPPAAAALGNSITHESSVLYHETRLLQIWEPYGAARAAPPSAHERGASRFRPVI